MGASEFWGFENFWGHYEVINGDQREHVFRLEVKFGVDARWLLNRF